MKKRVLFEVLLLGNKLKRAVNRQKPLPYGIPCQSILLFTDPDRPELGIHGVGVFVLPTGVGTERLGNLWGPYGKDGDTALLLKRFGHLYLSPGHVGRSQSASNQRQSRVKQTLPPVPRSCHRPCGDTGRGISRLGPIPLCPRPEISNHQSSHSKKS